MLSKVLLLILTLFALMYIGAVVFQHAIIHPWVTSVWAIGAVALGWTAYLAETRGRTG